MAVTITGTNEAPAVSVSDLSVGETGTATGHSVVTDVDATDAHTFHLVGADGANLGTSVTNDYGTFTIDAQTGDYSFTPSDHAASLGQGETAKFDFNVATNDGHVDSAAAPVAVTITGTNEAPVIHVADSVTSISGTESTSSAATVVTGGHIAATDVDSGDTLSYSVVADNATHHGALAIDAQGNYTFTATDNNWSGSDSFTVQVSDGHGGTADQVVNINVGGAADQATVGVHIGAATETPGGSFTVQNLDGSAGYSNTYGYYITDANGNPTTGQIIFANTHSEDNVAKTISGVDPDHVGFFIIPNGHSDNSSLTDGTSISFVKDSSGNWEAVDSSGHVLTGDGANVLFDKSSLNADNIGHAVDSSTDGGNQNWEDLAGGGDRDFNDVNTTVTWNTAAPVATHPLTVTANFPDMDGSESHAVSLSGLPAGATLYQDGVALTPVNGVYTLDPTHLTGLSIATPAGFSGDLNVTVAATSAENGTTATATASASVTDDLSDHNPVAAANVSYTDHVDTVLSGSVAATDPDGNHLSFTLGTGTAGPQHGSVVLQEDGSFTYTPSANYMGSDSFNVIVSDGHGGTTTQTVTVTEGDSGPTLAVHDLTTANDHTAISATAAGHDSDVGDTVSYSLVDASGAHVTSLDTAHGHVSINPSTGEYTFTPTNDASLAAGKTLPDSFSVVATDNHGVSSTPSTVNVTITGSDDAPTVSVANVTTANDHTAVTGHATGHDVDTGDTLTYHLSGANVSSSGGIETETTTHGTVALNTATGDYTFTPNADAAKLGVGATASDSFSVVATDSQGVSSSPSPVNVTITGSDDAPTVSVANVTTANDHTAVTGHATGHDVDTGDTLTYHLSGANVSSSGGIETETTTHGTVALNTATGDYTFTPNADAAKLGVGATASDSFSVVATDNHGLSSAPSTVAVTITGSDDAPVIHVADSVTSISGTESTSSAATVVTGGHIAATDVDSGDTLSYSVVADNATHHGALAIDAQGNYTFTATDNNWSGSDSFTVQVSDGHGGTANQVVNINVGGAADQATVGVQIGAAVSGQSASFTVTNLDHFSSAGYSNSYGYYITDANGNPTTGQIIFANTHSEDNVAKTISGVDPDHVGFFIIPNGHSDNSSLTDGTSISFVKDSSGNWEAVDSSGHVLTGDGANVLFDKSSLNADKITHAVDNSTGGNQNWEDLAGGGDRDFNDVNTNVVWTPATGTTHPLTVSAIFPDMDGSESHTVSLSGLPAGATLYQNGVALTPVNGVYTLDPTHLTGLSVSTPSTFHDTLNVTVTATSAENGTTATATASASVTDDHAPVIDTSHTTTAATIDGYNGLTATTGHVVATDVDSGDTVSYHLSGANVSTSGGIETETTTHGTVALNTATGDYTFTPTAGTSLAAGVSVTDNFSVVATDNHGLSSTPSTVAVTLTNSDIAPVANDDSTIDHMAQAPGLSVSLGTATSTTTAATHDFSVAGLSDLTVTTNTTASGNSAITGTSGADLINVTGTANGSINLGSGDDHLLINGSTAYGTTINAGTGNDVIRINGDANGNIILENSDGTGNNSLEVTGSTTYSATISAGAGNDTVKIGGNADSNINLGDGNNTLDIGGSNVWGATITAGSGNDMVKLGGAADAAINLGDGNNSLYVNGANVSGASITTGSGNDSVYIGGDADANINLGGGNNQLSVNGDVAWGTTLTAGSGNNYINVTGADNGVISTGSGNDEIHVGGVVNWGDSISTGAGNDLVTVGGAIYGTVDGGSGTDSIVLSGYSKADWNSNKDGIQGKVLNFENIKFSDGSVIGNSSAFAPATGTTTYRTPLTITATENDHDGSETLSTVTIGHVPSGATLELNGQALAANADGSYTISVTSGTPVTLTAVSNSAFDASTLTTTVSSTEANGGAVAVTTLVGTGSVAGQTTVDETIATPEDTKLTINASDLLHNDTDANGNTLSITSVEHATHGSVSIGADGNVVFTPDANYNGTATFDYTVSDGHGGTDTATVTIRVDAVNDAPVFSTSTGGSGSVNTTLSGTATATDVDGDTLTYHVANGVSDGHGHEIVTTDHGTVTLNTTDGSYTFSPTHNWAGSDSFNVSVSDGHGGTASEAVSVNVTGTGQPVGWGDGGGRTESWGSNGSWEVGGTDNHGNTITTSTDSHWGSGWYAWDSGNPGHAGTGDTISITGYNEHEHVIAGSASDTLIGSSGNDYISLDDGAGHQMITGITHIQLGDGNAILDMATPNMDYGNMTVAGGSGTDVMWTAGGNDLITAGNGTTTVHAGAGDDTIVAGAGNDTLLGQDGNDTFLFDFGHGHDTVDGGAGSNWTDTIDLSTNMHAGATITITTADNQSWTVASDGTHDTHATIQLGHDKAGDITIHSNQGDETIHFTNIEAIKY